jgi:hypothetical protein
MNLTRRTLFMFAITVLIAIVGLWGAEAAFRRLWLLPAALLMLGLAYEGLRQRSLGIEAVAATPARARLGRAFELALRWRSARPAILRFMPDVAAMLTTVARCDLTTGPRCDRRSRACPISAWRCSSASGCASTSSA